MDSSKIKAVVIIIISLFAALYMGLSAATDQLVTVAWVAGGSLLVLCIALGRHIWVLIPAALALGLTLMIPGRPTALMLAQALFIPFSLMLMLMRRLPWRFRFTEMDFWIIALIGCIAQVYLRNPVGLNLFGGENVGGRPYVLVALSIVTYFFLSNFLIQPDKLRWIPRIAIAGGLFSFALSVVGFFIPQVGVWLGKVNLDAVGGGVQEVEGVGTTGAGRATRVGFLGTFARDLALWVCAFKSPIRAIFHPFWLILILTAIACAGLSGFRNHIIAVGLTFVVGIVYRNGILGLLLSSLGAAMSVALIAVINLSFPLPANLQRSLSFLPGTWDQNVKLDAQQSTEWRLEIWKEAMLTERWINNKWLGDGLGFTARELAAQQNMASGAFSLSGLGHHQDAILANGDYHSGPIQTIRTTGYVGLAFLLIAQIRLGSLAHRQITLCRGSEWYPLALLVGIPLVWSPVFFVFVFGTFQSAMESLLLGAALIKILQVNLPLPAYSDRSAQTSLAVARLMRSKTPGPAGVA